MLDLVSIIVPVYNSEKFLNRCLDSLVNQTYKNIEIIVVDDGSSDGSLAICEEYSKKDKRIIVVHKENGGPSSSRNVGISKSSGRYLAFVDSDDYVQNNYIEALYKIVTENDLLYCSCSSYRNVKDDAQYLIRYDEKIIKDDEIFNLDWNMWCCWSKLFNKRYIGPLKFPEDQFIGEDHYFLTNLIIQSPNKTIGTTNLTKYYYTLNNDSICQRRIPFIQYKKEAKSHYLYICEVVKLTNNKNIINNLYKIFKNEHFNAMKYIKSLVPHNFIILNFRYYKLGIRIFTKMSPSNMVKFLLYPLILIRFYFIKIIKWLKYMYAKIRQ